MNPCTRIPLAAILLLLVACSENPVEPRAEDELSILVEVMVYETARYVTDGYAFMTFSMRSDGIPHDKSHTPHTAASDCLYSRIRSAPIPIRHFNICSVSTAGVLNPEFKDRGIAIWCGPITFTGVDSAVVYAGCYISAMGSEGDLVRVRREGGRWRVVGHSRMWIS